MSWENHIKHFIDCEDREGDMNITRNDKNDIRMMLLKSKRWKDYVDSLNIDLMTLASNDPIDFTTWILEDYIDTLQWIREESPAHKIPAKIKKYFDTLKDKP